MRKVVGYFGVLLFVALLVVGFSAYFVRSFDPSPGIWYDGLGRQLYSTPWFMQTFFGSDAEWPGWQWFIADMVIFWTGVLAGGAMVHFGFKKEGSATASRN